MSKELNKQFVEDPVDFAKKTPVVAPGSTAKQEHVKTWDKQPEELKGVPGRLRIIAGDLNNYTGVHAFLDLNYTNVADKISQGWMALYYLPWLEGNHVRTTLRPRKEGSGEKLMVTNGYQEDVNNPNIFFTAAVNGCMVSVMGPIDEPVVYHSNASLASETRIGSSDDPRIAHMTEGLQKFINAKVKIPRSTGEVQKVQAVTAAMYMPKDRQDALLDKGRQVVDEKTQVQDKKLMGTIFGKRTGGRWTFYYERLINYEALNLQTKRQRNNEKFWSEGIEEFEEVTGLVSQGFKYRLDDGTVHEFWPGGSGKVLFA